MAAKKETILVTGGAGRLGKALVTALIKNGKEVRVLIQQNEDAIRLAQGSIPYLGDIADQDALERACEGAEAVIHLAAIVSQYRAGSREILRTNTLGTRMVVQAAKKAGVKKIIFASTVNIYGKSRKEKLDEESEVRPTDTYGQSKRLAEEEIIKSGMNYTILRMATIYGPGFENSFLKIMGAIRNGKAYIVGNGNNHLALVHINDVVKAFMLALEKKISNKKIYNITDGREYTQEYLFGLAADLLGVSKPERHVSPLMVRIVAKAKGLDIDEVRFITSDRRVDISKARRELGYRPKESVESGASYLLNRFNMDHGNKQTD